MPSRLTRRKDYNLVDDTYDTRLPLHNDEAFQHGIQFKSKYIGTLDVPRPTGRMEIVVAMRRIRYEFKAKQVKKRKVNVTVSVDGVKVVLRKKKRKKDWAWDERKQLVMHDPVYRIFYVSHDSHDLKIWSYIARDGSSNVFRCNVFKSTKKSHAMRIVRTIGQAFEVCHKFSETRSAEGASDKEQEKKNEERQATVGGNERTEPNAVLETDIDAVETVDSEPEIISRSGVTDLDSVQAKPKSPDSLAKNKTIPTILPLTSGHAPLSAHHQIQLMQQQVQQSEQKSQFAVAKVQLLTDQLTAERAARTEAQTRNHQLLLQNCELISQVSVMVSQMKQLEVKLAKAQGISTPTGTSSSQLSEFPIGPIIVDTGGIMPNVNPMQTYKDLDLLKLQSQPILDSSLFENTNISSLPPTTPPSIRSDSSRGTRSKPSVGSKGRKSNGTFISSESSSESSSSSDEDEVATPIGHSQVSKTTSNASTTKATLSSSTTTKPDVLDLLNFDDTANTSVWTSGIVTPSQLQRNNSSYQRSMATDSLFDSSSVFSVSHSIQQPSANQTNGFTLSPILNLNNTSSSTSTTPRTEPNNRKNKESPSTNPIKWRPLSPPSSNSTDSPTSNKTATPSSETKSLPKIDPPPKVTRNSSVTSPTGSRMRPQLSGSSLPMDETIVLSDSSLMQVEGEVPQATTTSKAPENFGFAQSAENPSQKLFDFDPATYERQLRYEPLQKVKSAAWQQSTVMTQAQLSTSTGAEKFNVKKVHSETFVSDFADAPKVLPLETNDETDVTIGSMLDDIESQFMTEFWEGDTSESMCAPILPEIPDKDTSSSSDNIDLPNLSNTESHVLNSSTPIPTCDAQMTEQHSSGPKVSSQSTSAGDKVSLSIPSNLPLTKNTHSGSGSVSVASSDSGLGNAMKSSQNTRSPGQQKASPLSDNSTISR